ncbi:MAG: hypothetical protein ACR2J3_04285 [Aridibacter sp.]
MSEIQIEKNSLITSLKILDSEADKFSNSSKKALVKAQIADALWYLNKDAAKKILRNAYYFSLPSEEERTKLKERTKETAPVEPSVADIDRFKIRSQILEIARRDAEFAKELTKISEKELGEIEKAETYNSLAVKSIKDGKINDAKDFINQAIQIDPTQQIGWSIMQLAAENRETADELVLQYIQTLRTTPLSAESFFQAISSLQMAVFPQPLFDFGRNRQIPNSSPAVIKTFLQMILEKMTAFEKNQPGSMSEHRADLSSLWIPLNRYAPELLDNWHWLEQITRGSGKSPIDQSLESQPKKDQDQYKEKVEEALESKEINALSQAIREAVYRNDFKTARKVLDVIEDEEIKNKALDFINSSEAIWLVKKGEISEAGKLAEKLKYSRYILKTFPIIIEKCVELKEQNCAYNFSNEAIGFLKRNKTEEIPSYFFSSLIKSVYKLDNAMAFSILEEMLKVYNNRKKAEGINLGFDDEIFKLLAEKDEARTFQLAESFTDDFPRIISLAQIYKWKSKRILKDIENLTRQKDTNIPSERNIKNKR